MKKLTVVASILSAALFFSCKKDLRENSVADETGIAITSRTGPTGLAFDSAEHVPNQLLVRFKKGTTKASKEDVFLKIAGKVQEHVLSTVSQRFGDSEGFYVLNTPLNALEALSKIKGGRDIENVELNYIYTHYETSEDSYYTNGSLWGMYSDDDPTASTTFNRYGSHAEKAWAAGHIGNEAVFIGVIDEGVMDKHTDLNGNVDPTKGWDFHNNDASTYDGTSDDHGTHVAGTIGAKGSTSKSTGVVGVNWKVKMIPAKFLGPRGGSTANAIKAIKHITNLKVNQKVNVIATNNSWGGPGYSKELELAIEEANKAGILFVCAAGNDGRNIDDSRYHTYPACYFNPNIIVVAALTDAGLKASYSNYGQLGLNVLGGPDHSFVDIAAPGSGIFSTVPGKNNSSSYASYNGTSMATPHVAGAVALYAATKNLTNIDSLQAQNIKAAVLNSARPTQAFYPASAPRLSITGGRLDVNRAINHDYTPLPAD